MLYFEYKIDVHGAAIVPAAERLTTASLSPAEIDVQLVALKRDLDRVAKEMKAAVARQQRASLGLRTTPNT